MLADTKQEIMSYKIEFLKPYKQMLTSTQCMMWTSQGYINL